MDVFTEKKNLAPLSKLFSDTWGGFKKTWLALILLMVATAAAILGLVVIAALVIAVGYGLISLSQLFVIPAIILAIPIATVLIVALVAIILIAQAAIMVAVRDRAKPEQFRETIVNSLALAGPLWLVKFLYGIAAVVGTLLLVIPGIYAAVILAFYGWALIVDKKHGLDALLFSARLVRGRFWPVLGRFLIPIAVVFVIQIAIGLPQDYFAESEQWIGYFLMTFVGWIASIATNIYMLNFGLTLYKDLKRAS